MTTTPHNAPIDRPATEAAQDGAAVSELCKAVDHVREARWLLSENSPHFATLGRVLIELRTLIDNASRGRIQP